MASSLALDHVHVAFNGQAVVRDVTLSIEAGQSVAIIGRSGAGKTTILRLLNGLVKPSGGSVFIDGTPLDDDLVMRRRRIGTILQSPALFPHRTVFENLAIVPRLLEWSEDRILLSARELLDQLGMPFDRFATRFPRSLSGGEQQRVGIGRAMMSRPPLLLCDEPFGALDPIVRRELQDVFMDLRHRGDVTMVFVTHDLGEALRVAQRIVLVDDGAIVCDASREQFVVSDIPLVRRFVDAARLPEGSP